MIKLTPESIWLLAEEIPYTVHADTQLASDIERMACDETFISLETSDPVIKQLCDLWEIKYQTI